LKLYIIDDDWDMIQYMTVLLEGAGHTVFSGVSGVSNLPKIVARKPDAIIADLVMAEMDGIELIRQLRAKSELADSKIIMVTSKDHDHWRKQAKEAGANGYITKPLDEATFASQIEAIVLAS
jgi:DNA-binding response OmpR family regulator